MIHKTCKHCNKDFECRKRKRIFCSSTCAIEHKAAKILCKCAMCQVDILKTKSQLTTSKSKLLFCSKKCSCTYWNISGQVNRRKVEGTCVSCSSPIASRRKYCDTCIPKNLIEMVTIGSLYSRYDNHPSLKSARVRHHSRKVYSASGLPRRCEICGYSKFYEVCHITPISSFSKDTLVGTVNAIANLVALCPNCHWEFDHGMVPTESITDIVKHRQSK